MKNGQRRIDPWCDSALTFAQIFSLLGDFVFVLVSLSVVFGLVFCWTIRETTIRLNLCIKNDGFNANNQGNNALQPRAHLPETEIVRLSCENRHVLYKIDHFSTESRHYSDLGEARGAF